MDEKKTWTLGRRSFDEARFPGCWYRWKNSSAWKGTRPDLPLSRRSTSAYPEEYQWHQVSTSLASNSACVYGLVALELRVPRSCHGKAEKISPAVYGSVLRTVAE